MKNNIKVQRAIAGLTQADLAEKTGVSRQTVNAIEKGKFCLLYTSDAADE